MRLWGCGSWNGGGGKVGCVGWIRIVIKSGVWWDDDVSKCRLRPMALDEPLDAFERRVRVDRGVMIAIRWGIAF